MIPGMATETQLKVPECVGIIMDGNRRWARKRGLPGYLGHSQGKEKLKEFISFAKKAGVKYIIAFAFSTENWKRPEEEVSYLLGILLKIFRDDREDFIREQIRVRYAGDISTFPQELQSEMRRLEEDTKHFEGLVLTLCLSYGGRSELLHAMNSCLAEGVGEVTEQEISKRLYTAGMPDPDMIIRTSGEMRLSGFLPWQTAYSELFFTNTLWPDFSEKEFLGMVQEYSSRERRMGK